jgi:hypothetical protein
VTTAAILTHSQSAILTLAPSLVAFASVAVAALAIRANRRTTDSSLLQQSRLVHDERVWRERSDTYLEVLMWMDERSRQLAQITADPNTMWLSKDREEYHRRTLAKVTTYASQDLIDLISNWRYQNTSFATLWQDLLQGKEAIMAVTGDEDAIRRALFEELECFNETASLIEVKLTEFKEKIEVRIRDELLTQKMN